MGNVAVDRPNFQKALEGNIRIWLTAGHVFRLAGVRHRELTVENIAQASAHIRKALRDELSLTDFFICCIGRTSHLAGYSNSSNSRRFGQGGVLASRRTDSDRVPEEKKRTAARREMPEPVFERARRDEGSLQGSDGNSYDGATANVMLIRPLSLPASNKLTPSRIAGLDEETLVMNLAAKLPDWKTYALIARTLLERDLAVVRPLLAASPLWPKGLPDGRYHEVLEAFGLAARKSAHHRELLAMGPAAFPAMGVCFAFSGRPEILSEYFSDKDNYASFIRYAAGCQADVLSTDVVGRRMGDELIVECMAMDILGRRRATRDVELMIHSLLSNNKAGGKADKSRFRETVCRALVAMGPAVRREVASHLREHQTYAAQCLVGVLMSLPLDADSLAALAHFRIREDVEERIRHAGRQTIRDAAVILLESGDEKDNIAGMDLVKDFRLEQERWRVLKFMVSRKAAIFEKAKECFGNSARCLCSTLVKSQLWPQGLARTSSEMVAVWNAFEAMQSDSILKTVSLFPAAVACLPIGLWFRYGSSDHNWDREEVRKIGADKKYPIFVNYVAQSPAGTLAQSPAGTLAQSGAAVFSDREFEEYMRNRTDALREVVVDILRARYARLMRDRRQAAGSARGDGSAVKAIKFANLSYPIEETQKLKAHVLLSGRCGLGCPQCLNEEWGPDLSEEEVYDILDSLRGADRIVLLGPGETTAYGKAAADLLKPGVSESFARIVEYASRCAREVEIVTNGTCIPTDIEEARRFFSRFAPNVIWTISVDFYHEKRIAEKAHRSLKELTRMMEALYAEEAVDAGYWVTCHLEEGEDSDIIYAFELEDAYLAGRVNTFSVVRQGGAARNCFDGAKSLDREGLLAAAIPEHEAALCVGLKGDVFVSIAPVFMRREERAQYALGNIHERPLAEIILQVYKTQALERRNVSNPAVYAAWMKVLSALALGDSRAVKQALNELRGCDLAERRSFAKDLPAAVNTGITRYVSIAASVETFIQAA